MQKHLGFNDEEMQQFRDNPKNEEIMLKVPALMTYIPHFRICIH
jgi:hypothetical protein